MFFDQLESIPQIASKVSCSIFVVPADYQIPLKNAVNLHPDDKKTSNIISVEQIRDFISLTNNKETSERFFVISPAESMNEAAQNAFLKTFEEPKEHCHFVLLTQNLALLLPTILSRAQIYILRTPQSLEQAPVASEKIMHYAKALIAAQPQDLPELATELTKTKTQPREQALRVVATAIELLYKSYFKTGNIKFLAKIQNFINLHEHLTQNCHIKLHIVADLC